MITAFILGIILIPLWAFAPNQILLVAGAFLMQFMVQGAWGVIPAHLAELSPNSVRAFLPGSLVDVETKNRHYRIECLGGSAMRISGHPEYYPSPVPGRVLEAGLIERGRHLHLLLEDRLLQLPAVLQQHVLLLDLDAGGALADVFVGLRHAQHHEHV